MRRVTSCGIVQQSHKNMNTFRTKNGYMYVMELFLLSYVIEMKCLCQVFVLTEIFNVL